MKLNDQQLGIPETIYKGLSTDIEVQCTNPGMIAFATDLNKYGYRNDIEWIWGTGITEVSWNEITDKPDTFPPSSHTHSGTDIVSIVPSASDSDTLDGYHADHFSISGHNHDSRYYTETELATAGMSVVDWGNITNAPSFSGSGDSNWTKSGNDIQNNNTGNVGVGGTPTAKFEVFGAGKIRDAMIQNSLASGDTLLISSGWQMIVYGKYDAIGTIVCEGDLVIL